MATILVVDDDPDSLMMLKTMIRVELGFDVITARSGDEALTKAHQADAILTDIVMPVMDGLQLCRALNQQENTKNIPVILMTSYLGPDITERVKRMELGFIDFLLKPLKKEELISRLKVMLRVKDAEARLKKAHLPPRDQLYLLLAAFEVTTEGITITDGKGKWVFVNQAEAEMFGCTIDELMTLEPAKLYDEASCEKIQSEIIPAMKKSSHWEGELVGKKKSGKTFPVLLSFTSLADERNKFLGIMVLTKDISAIKKVENDLKQRSWELLSVNQHLQKAYDELKETQQALLRAERMKTAGIMAGGLAHDIRNLLAVLQGGIDIIDHCLSHKKLDQLEEGWQMLKRGHQRVAVLVEDLLYCSREVKPDYQLNDILEAIREETTFLSDQLNTKHIKLKLDLSPDIPKFYFDSKIIRRCIGNLVINAIDALENQKHPWITISTSHNPEAKTAIISVGDNGRGMSETELERIFEIFFTTKKKGIGIGLVIVKKAVSEHEGQLQVTSQKDHGTKFTITLPLRRKS